MVASFCCYNTRYHTICSWTCHIYLDTNFIVGVFLVLINLFRKGLLWCFPLIQAKNSIKFKLFSKLYQKSSATHAIFVAWHFCFLLQGSANFIIENLFYDCWTEIWNKESLKNRNFLIITRQTYEHSKIKNIFNILHANESYFCCLIIAKKWDIKSLRENKTKVNCWVVKIHSVNITVRYLSLYHIEIESL